MNVTKYDPCIYNICFMNEGNENEIRYDDSVFEIESESGDFSLQ